MTSDTPTSQLLDGKALAQEVRARIRTEVLALAGPPPGLTILLVGEDPASQVYVRNKEKDGVEVGLRSTIERLPADVAQNVVRDRILALNADPAVHGILVQLPLPAHLDARVLLDLIDPAKDVDGFHPVNQGRLALGEPGLAPCTPTGVMALLRRHEVPLSGREAVVIGRSTIVGKPMALMLLAADATVTVCHSRTRDLADHVRRADVVVAAVGRANLVRGDWIKPGAAVVDVGMNVGADGKLVGDVAFAEVRERAGWITPVPGGVGPMTRAILLQNTLSAYRAQVGRQA